MCKLGGALQMVVRARAPALVQHTRLLSAAAASPDSGPLELRALGDGVTLYGLRAPRARNALSRNVVQCMQAAHRVLRADTTCRVLVVHSLVPGVFCAGADLKERARMDDNEVAEFVRELRHTLSEVERLPMVTVAALGGAALGGGLELALACDLRVAADTARLGLVETARGLLPGAGGTQRLPRLVSPAVAKELIFTARIVSGSEAARLGLVNQCIETPPEASPAAVLDTTLSAALQLSRQIAANAPLAVRAAKRAIDEGLALPLQASYQVEQRCYEDNIHTRDRREGAQAFIEKRAPVFKGH